MDEISDTALLQEKPVWGESANSHEHFDKVRRWNYAKRDADEKAGVFPDARGNTASIQDRQAARDNPAHVDDGDRFPPDIPAWVLAAVKTLPFTDRIAALKTELSMRHASVLQIEKRIVDLKIDRRHALRKKIATAGEDTKTPNPLSVLIAEKEAELEECVAMRKEALAALKAECESVRNARLTEIAEAEGVADAKEFEARSKLGDALLAVVEASAALGVIPYDADHSALGLIHFVHISAPLLSGAMRPASKPVFEISADTIKASITKGSAVRAALDVARPNDRHKLEHETAVDAFVQHVLETK